MITVGNWTLGDDRRRRRHFRRHRKAADHRHLVAHDELFGDLLRGRRAAVADIAIDQLDLAPPDFGPWTAMKVRCRKRSRMPTLANGPVKSEMMPMRSLSCAAAIRVDTGSAHATSASVTRAVCPTSSTSLWTAGFTGLAASLFF